MNVYYQNKTMKFFKPYTIYESLMFLQFNDRILSGKNEGLTKSFTVKNEK